jgi:hypothetical protein
VVRDRAPKHTSRCNLCLEQIECGYIREFGTELFYCSTLCFYGHVETTVALLEAS